MSFYMMCIIILSSHLIKLKTFYTFCSRRQTRLLQFNSFFIICCLRWRTLLSVDDMMENVVNILQKKNLLDNTYIVFSSDNGFHLGEFFCLIFCFLGFLRFPHPWYMKVSNILQFCQHLLIRFRYQFWTNKISFKSCEIYIHVNIRTKTIYIDYCFARKCCDFFLSRSVFNALRQKAIVRIWCSSAIDDSWTQCVTWEAD